MKDAMRIAGLGICLLLAAGAAARGAEEFTDARGRIDEIVADTTDTPAPSALEPLAAPIPFRNFRYPYVDPAQNVTFIADDPLYDGSKGANLGIYRSYASGGRLETLVSSKTPAPGTGAGFRYIRGLHLADNLTDFVFSGITTDDRNGIYAWRSGVLSTIARSGETVLDGRTVTDVDYASFSGEKVLYVARTDAGPSLVLCDLAEGGAQKVLMHGGQPIPGSETDAFRYFSPQNWIDGNQVVFRAARVPDPYDGDGKSKAERGLYGWVGKSDFRPGQLRRFVDWTTPVPGVPGGAFVNLRSAPVRGDLITFVGSGEGFTGIYWMKTTDTAPRPIVDTSTEMETLFKGAFDSFGIYPAIIDRSIVFTASADDYAGVFLYRPDEDRLFVLTDSRALVGGKKIEGFEIATSCMVGNRLAVKAMFSDRTQGVYLATVPGISVSRSAAR